MRKQFNLGVKVSTKKSHKSNKVKEIICILDGSGSMTALKQSTINGFNEFLQEQKKKAKKQEILLTVFVFHDKPQSWTSNQFGYFNNNNTWNQYSTLGLHIPNPDLPHCEFDTLYNRRNILECKPLTSNQYKCLGGTPLLDSIGTVIDKTSDIVSQDKTSVLCVIMTDGEENSSVKYNSFRIKSMIESKKEMGWSFCFIGANMSSFTEASDMGFAGMTISMSNTDRGYNSAWKCLNECTNSFYNSGKLTQSSLNACVSNYSAELSTEKIK